MERTQFCEAPIEQLRRPIGDLLLAFDAAERAVVNEGHLIPAALAERAFSAFDHLVVEFNRLVADAPPLAAEALGRELQAALLPFIQMARTAGRAYAKPCGYAGDYLTIAQMYENCPAGTGRLGGLTDACFLSLPCSVAVRNRRALFCDVIQKLFMRNLGRRVRVASLACGPACEIFDVYRGIEAARRIETTLIDIDREAISGLQEKIVALNLQDSIRCKIANLALVAKGRTPLNLHNQDLIYSIGLIDYFADEIVIGLLDAIHDALAPGGSVIVGNFHPRNPSRAVMDHVLEWKLIYRTEEDMQRLFLASAFRRDPDRVFYESQGINLFAECRREET